MDRSNAADGDERDDRIDLVGGRDLAGNSMAEVRINRLRVSNVEVASGDVSRSGNRTAMKTAMSREGGGCSR